MRKVLLLALFALALFSCGQKKNLQKVEQVQPNILLLFSDDHQASAINALGNPYIQTPNIDDT